MTYQENIHKAVAWASPPNTPVRQTQNIRFNEHLPLSIPHCFHFTLFQLQKCRIANWIWISTSVLYKFNGGAVILKVGEQRISSQAERAKNCSPLWAPSSSWAPWSSWPIYLHEALSHPCGPLTVMWGPFTNGRGWSSPIISIPVLTEAAAPTDNCFSCRV